MAVAAKKIQPQKPNFMAALKQTQTVEKSKGKSKMPTIQAPPNIQLIIDQYIAAKEKEKIAKAEKESVEDAIIDFVRKRQDEDGFKHHHSSSYAVGSQPLKFVSSNRFTLSTDDVAQLQDLFQEHYGEMILEKYDVSLKSEVMENEELQAELMGLVGERFAEFFETKMKLSVCENFDRRVYDVLTEKEMPTFRTFCRQYKPSLR